MGKPQTRMKQVVVKLAAGTKVRVRVQRTSGTDTIDTKAGSGLTIKGA